MDEAQANDRRLFGLRPGGRRRGPEPRVLADARATTRASAGLRARRPWPPGGGLPT